MPVSQIALALFLVAAPAPDEPPPPPPETPDLQQRIGEKISEIQRQEEALRELKGELSDLQGEHAEASRAPFFALSAQALYTFWEHDLDLDDGVGFGGALHVGFSESRYVKKRFWRRDAAPAREPVRLEHSLFLGVRYWEGDDERRDGYVDVVSYQMLGLAGRAFDSERGWGGRFSLAGGVTRFNSDAYDGDDDTGPSVNLGAGVEYRFVPALRLGAGVNWDLVWTDFNQNDTHMRQALSPYWSLELAW
jgi:hypothetical protein